MSLFCFCIVENIKKSEIDLCSQKLKTLAKKHNRGIKFSIDWSDPILSGIKKDSFIINITDNPESDNCELFLLPDGWYYNGETNELAFSERMLLLQDISNVFIDRGYIVEIFLGVSGMRPDELFNVKLKMEDLINYLTKTVGVVGADGGTHISIIP